ncbi:MAG: hypothetical protein EPN85_12300 [Bacteroidetes bacterium]|nr:MAG: hypothetical protein EPN85_12300 [Bacteroidota bacterium]
MRIFCFLSFAFCLLPSILSFSQTNQNLTLFRERNLMLEKYLNGKDYNTHTSLRPFINSSELQVISDSIQMSMKRRSDTLLRSSNLMQNGSRNRISVTGLFDACIGYEQSTKSDTKLQPAGGLMFELNLKEKITFSSTFISGNSAFPAHINTFINYTDVVPGIGSAYLSKNGFSYQYYAGYLSYSPNKTFNFQAGKDKNFFGDGYRSLFLSDVSNSYPFLKVSTTVWKLKYVSLFTWMKDVTNPSHLKKDFLNKYGTFHYISWNVSKRFNVALFESIIWQGTDSNRVRNYEVNYLNPVIFFRPVEYSLGSSDNACLGASFKIKVGERYRQQFYGQIILDEFLLKEVLAIFKKLAHPTDPSIKYGWWANKQGLQFGFKSFDLFTMKNLIFQTEINAVRPYTYTHGSVQQNYAHYNQPLAHPLGANFAESVSFLNYQHKKWLFETEFLYAMYGKDENGKNYGQNIFESYSTHPNEYGNKFFQGLKTNLLYTKLKIGYYFIPTANLIAEAGVAVRQEKNSVSSVGSNFIFIGIKTGIMNRYSDF